MEVLYWLPSPRPSPRKRRQTRHSILLEDHLRASLEDENRRRAARYVADDKWEEANTTVWFPCQRHKRAWDYLILVVLLYSIVMEPFRIGLAVEAMTGKGIIQQVWGFNESTKGIDFSGLLNFFS